MEIGKTNTDFLSETIGERLKRLRKEKGYIQIEGEQRKLTQYALARYVLHYENDRQYRNYELDKCDIPLNNLITLADFYQVSVDYLLCRTHYTSCDNEMISNSIGLSDKSIENIRAVIASDIELNNYIMASGLNYPPRDLVSNLDLVLSSEHLQVVLYAINMFMARGYNIPVVWDRIGGLASWYATDQNPYLDKTTNYISLAKSMANPRDKIEIPISDTIIETTALKEIEKVLYDIKKGVAD